MRPEDIQSKKITPKTEQAITEYIKHRIVNGETTYTYKDAMLLVGYSPHYVSRSWVKMSKNDIVVARIASFTQKASIKAELTVSKVLIGIGEALEMAKQKNDVTNMLKALELQGKHLAMFTDVQVTDSYRMEEVDKLTLQHAKLFAKNVIPKMLPGIVNEDKIALDDKGTQPSRQTPPICDSNTQLNSDVIE